MKNNWIDKLTYTIIVAVIVLLILKWCGVLNINYWIVFSPLLALLGVLILVTVISVTIGSIAYAFHKWKKKKK